MKDSNSHNIQLSLGLRNISEKEYSRIKSNVQKFYNISDFSYFTPHIKLFSNFINNSKALNNKYNLFELVSKKKRFGITGYCYNAKVKTSSNNIFHKKVFVKEVPLFEPTNIDLYYKSVNEKLSNISPVGQAVNDGFYNLNNPNNVEMFTCYLTSKLIDENISPSFNRYFGCYYVNLDKYTYDIGNSECIISQLEDLLNANENIKYRQKSSESLMEYPNVPTYLLITEYERFSIDYLALNELLSYELIMSCVFQIFAAIITMKKHFGIKHNDLHFGNIMISKTDKEFIYYSCNQTLYKVPTHGYIFKIIDWGRSTYDFNGIVGKNKVFTGPGECFEQYIYSRINESGKEPLELDYGDWTDIVMFSHSVLYEYSSYLDDTPLGSALKKVITSTDKEQLEIKEFDWDLYLAITESEFSVKPIDILCGSLFSSFKLSKKGNNKKNRKHAFPKDVIVYNV
jgi:hypothetical protein